MFADRRDVGRQLAERLAGFAREDPVVVSLPRGALLVADEVADRLNAPLRLMLARPLRPLTSPEKPVGAVAEGGALVLDAAAQARVPRPDVDQEIALETVELYRRSARVKTWAPIAVVRRTAILVDDGTSTQALREAAILALRAERPGRIVYATPAVQAENFVRWRSSVDHLVVLREDRPEPLYRLDDAVDDDMIQRILRERGA